MKPEPIHVDNQEEFTFYSLEESGEEYVSKKLIPSIADKGQDEESVFNIFSLLSVFKDKNRKEWIDRLENIFMMNKTYVMCIKKFDNTYNVYHNKSIKA